MKKNIVIVILTLLIAGAGYLAWHQWQVAEETSTQLSDSKAANAQLEQAHSALESQVNSFRKELDTREDQIDTLQQGLDSLEVNLKEHREQEARLHAALVERDTHILDLEFQIEQMQPFLDEAWRQLLKMSNGEWDTPDNPAKDWPHSDNTPAVDIQELDSIPNVIYMGEIEYPLELKRQRIEGLVLLKVVITEWGTVKVAEVLEATHLGFVMPAVRAAQSSFFVPPMQNGKKVAAFFILPIRFSMGDADTEQQPQDQ